MLLRLLCGDQVADVSHGQVVRELHRRQHQEDEDVPAR